MTQFTSFVAVEEMTVTDAGEPRRIEVPVEMPEGVSHEGVFARDQPFEKLQLLADLQRAPIASRVQGGGGGGGTIPRRGQLPRATRAKPGVGIGRSNGVGSGVGGGSGPGEGRGTGPRLGGGSKASPPLTNSGITLAESVGLSSKDERVSAEEQTQREHLAKLNPSVAAVIERLKTKKAPGPDETKFVRNGKAEIQIWLSDKSAKTLAQLTELGFEVVLDPKAKKLIIGRIAVEKLAALSELSVVRYVSPMVSN
jgi:hypothetical protein